MKEEQICVEKRKRIFSLQAVRALAFCGVFTSHSRVTHLGAWGVSVFFILSGFVMVYSYYDKSLDSSVKGGITFSLSKIKRLYPLHILMLLTAVPAEYLFKSKTIKEFVLKFFSNAMLLQAWIPSTQYYASFNRVGWYLSACLFIYAMFPVVLKLIRNLDNRKALILAIVTYALQIIIGSLSQFVNLPYDFKFSYWVIYFLPLFRLGDFIIGCCICILYLNRKTFISSITASLCEILTFVAIVLAQVYLVNHIGVTEFAWFRYNMLFTPSSVCLVYLFAVNKGILSRMLTCKPIIYIGNISAYTYLIHTMAIDYFDVFLGTINVSLNLYIKAVIVFIVTIISAEIYKHIENAIRRKLVLNHA